MTAIHRIDPELWVTTPRGEAHALFLIDYGPAVNSVWVVALLDSGDVLHVDSCEARVMVGNAMWGIPQPAPFGGAEHAAVRAGTEGRTEGGVG